MRLARAFVGSSLLLWAVLLLLNRSLREVSGVSMRPALRAGQRVLVLPRALRRPRVGGLAVVRDPRDPDNEVIKRVVAAGPATVELRGGRLIVDGVEVHEPYATPDVSEELRPLRRGELYVLGDHRAASTDSRTFGPVSADGARAVVPLPWPPAGDGSDRRGFRGRGRQPNRESSLGGRRSSSGAPARE